MFGNWKIEISDLKVKIEELRKENLELKLRVESADKVIERINNSVREAEYIVDWAKMDAFSIERNVNDNKPVTIIGYYLEEPVLSSDGEMVVMRKTVKEWYMYCSETRHQELVDSFKAYRKGAK